jgi:hypothetical protein
VIDLAAHGQTEVTERLAHRWPGFSDDAMHRLLAGAGLNPGTRIPIPGPLELRIWPATRAPATVASETTLHAHV